MTGPAVPVVPVVPGTVLALKEWAAAVHALLDGRQTLLLRKGGIHEKRFSVRGSRFVVFPTVAHSHAECTRGEHADLLALGGADVADGSVVVRAELSVAATIAVRRPDRIAELEHFFKGGEATLEVIETYASGDLAVLVAVERQHGEVGEYPAQDWSLRVTLVFRREASTWRLVHRHADALVHPITFEQLAHLARGG